jgi:hypothetical protein
MSDRLISLLYGASAGAATVQLGGPPVYVVAIFLAAGLAVDFARVFLQPPEQEATDE